MGYRILFVAATPAEADAVKRIRRINDMKGFNRIENLSIETLVTGIGSVSTAWALKNCFDNNPHPDLAVNIGIAGSYNTCYKIGDVVMPVKDCFADFGIENSENEFISVFESGLLPKNEFPYQNGFLKSDVKSFPGIERVVPNVKAVTVNTATGSALTIEKIKNKYNPDVETMEGATFFYICAMEKVPCLAVRAVSNRVEPRNRDNWNIPLALNNLADRLEEILLVLK